MDIKNSNVLEQIKSLANNLSAEELTQLQFFFANRAKEKKKEEQQIALAKINEIAKSIGLPLKEILHPKPSKKKD